MIVVIADDLTGAAEVAGAARQRGYAAEVHLQEFFGGDAEVVAVDAQTRSLDPSRARRRVTDLTRRVLASGPAWVFKKIDSVLRGSVLEETLAMLEASGRRRALIAAANPSRRRVVKDGRYWIDGVALHATPFSSDPEYPAATSEIVEILADRATPPTAAQREWLQRVELPDVLDDSDLKRIASRAGPEVLPVGGVEFFTALLDARGPQPRSGARVPEDQSRATPAAKTLFLCGSATAWAAGREQQCQTHGVPVATMPEACFRDPECGAAAEWACQIASLFDEAPQVMAAIGRDQDRPLTLPSPPRGRGDCGSYFLDDPKLVPGNEPKQLADCLARVAAETIRRRGDVERICVEGGATAAALLDQWAWGIMAVRRQIQPGIVALSRADGSSKLEVVVKPGSYDWTAAIWQST